MRTAGVKAIIDDDTAHIEIVHKDNGASEYAMKEETRLDGPMEFGTKKMVKGGGDRKSMTYIETKALAGITREQWETNLTPFQII